MDGNRQKMEVYCKNFPAGGGKKLNNGIFILLFTFVFFYLLAFTSFAEVSCTTVDGTKLTVSSYNTEVAMYNVDEALNEVGKNRSDIKEILIGDDITSIGGYAFYGCSGLTSITIPNTVTSIERYAFQGCSGLTSITFGKGSQLKTIGGGAFDGCSGLITITIPDGVTTIGEHAFVGCSGLTSITIPDSVTSIGNYTFSDCNQLENIEIPNTVTSIGEYAFNGCSGLTSVTFEKGSKLGSIGNNAFGHCNNLQSITIPDNVTSIGKYAFLGCSSLTDVYYIGTKEEWENLKANIGDSNGKLKDATIHYNCKILTLKKIWKDGGDGSKRKIPQFILYKNGNSTPLTEDVDYRIDACLYNDKSDDDIKDVLGIDSNGAKYITEGAKGVDTWVYKFIVAKYAVSEIEVPGYDSSAKYIGNTGS